MSFCGAPKPISPCANLSNQFFSGGNEVLHWNATNTLVLHDVAAGQHPTWTISAVNTNTNAPDSRSGAFTEASAGTYTATIPALYPLHGAATLTVAGLLCPLNGGTAIGGDF